MFSSPSLDVQEYLAIHRHAATIVGCTNLGEPGGLAAGGRAVALLTLGFCASGASSSTLFIARSRESFSAF